MSEKNGVLLSHPTGNSNVREVLRVLQEINALKAFYTTLGFSEESLIFKYSGPSFKKTLKRRSYKIPTALLHTCYSNEVIRILKRRLQQHKQREHHLEIDQLYNDQDQRVAEALKKHSLKAVYAYEDGALNTFKIAKQQGIKTLYELPIAYWETAHHLLKEEATRYPEWEGTLITTRDGPAKCKRKSEEIELADHIICPSDFVKRSIPPSILSNKPCTVLPYGAPLPELTNNWNNPRQQGPLKILFAGSLSQRKGLADLFTAMKLVGPAKAHLTVVGTPILPISFYKKQFPGFTYFSSMPQAALFQLMQNQDLLALPSIIEGRALVQLEALGCGLPILITPNTGGEDMVTDSENGFLIPIRSPEAIAEKINWLYTHQEQLPAFRKNARTSAEQNGWATYRKQLAHFLNSVLN